MFFQQGTTPSVVTFYHGSRDVVRVAQRLNNILEEVHDVMIASRSKSTYTKYNTGLKRWWCFCNSFQLDPYKYNVNDVLKFLKAKYDNDMAEGTLNSFRSAIVAIHGPQLGEDSSMKIFYLKSK